MLYLIYFLLYLFTFVLGISIGSFMNVLTYRLPNHISLKGRSFCPVCKEQIKNYDLIPILSFIFLKGKCRNCKAKISIRYLLAELLFGVVTVIIFIHFYFTAKALLAFAFCAILMTISDIDFKHSYIPNCLIVSLLLSAIVSFFVFSDVSLLSHGIGFVAFSLPLVALNLIKKNSIGFDDIKFIALIGLFLGFKLCAVGLLLSVLLTGIYLIIIAILKKIKKSDRISIIPFISLGSMLSLMYGEKLLAVYINLLDIISKGLTHA